MRAKRRSIRECIHAIKLYYSSSPPIGPNPAFLLHISQFPARTCWKRNAARTELGRYHDLSIQIFTVAVRSLL